MIKTVTSRLHILESLDKIFNMLTEIEEMAEEQDVKMTRLF